LRVEGYEGYKGYEDEDEDKDEEEDEVQDGGKAVTKPCKRVQC